MSATIEQTRKPGHAFVERFTEFEARAGANGSGWTLARRREAIERFAEVGLPGVKDEAWRFTNLAKFGKIDFQDPAAPGRATAEVERRVGEVSFGGDEVTRLVFVDGAYCDSLSNDGGVRDGVVIGTVAGATGEEIGLLEKYLGAYAKADACPFVALNTAYMSDGALIHIPKGVVAPAPIHLIFIATGGGEPTANYPRNLIVAEEASQVSIVETYAGANSGDQSDEGVTFTNTVTEIVLGASAVVDHHKVQIEGASAFHIGHVEARQARSSNLRQHLFSSGACLARNNANSFLAGEGAECTLNGLTLATGAQHIDNQTRLDHAAAHCDSHELYKSIVGGKAHAIFTGLIHVHPDAQKTDAKQSSANLLLADTARADAQPQLEIYADDVKCTHGATIGQLDPDAIFYLRSRGIGPAAARNLLTEAFARELTGRIGIEPLREQLDARLSAWLAEEAGV